MANTDEVQQALLDAVKKNASAAAGNINSEAAKSYGAAAKALAEAYVMVLEPLRYATGNRSN